MAVTTINPLKLDGNDSHAILLAQLFEKYKLPRYAKFKRNTPYPIEIADPKNPSVTITINIQLTNTIIKRKSHREIHDNKKSLEDSTAYRYEVKDHTKTYGPFLNKRNFIGKGVFGIAKDIAATIKVENGKAVYSRRPMKKKDKYESKQKRRIVKKIKMDLSSEKDIIRESRLNRHAKHLKSKEVVFETDAKTKNYKSGYIVMGKLPGRSLADVLEDDASGKKKLTLQQRYLISSNLLRALKSQMHDVGIIHHDIKPENIFYDEKTGEVNIYDLGMAKLKSASSDEEVVQMRYSNDNSKYNHSDGIDLFHPPTKGGTPEFAAAEQFSHSANTTEKTDIYSAGKTLILLWRGYFFAEGKGSHHPAISLFRGIENQLTMTEQDEITKLINKMTSQSPNDRPELTTLIELIDNLQKENLSHHPNLIPLLEDLKRTYHAADPQTELTELQVRIINSLLRYHDDLSKKSKDIFKEKVDPNKKMNIANLYYYVVNATDCDSLKSDIKDYLKNMKTGFFGNSNLKDYLNKEMDRPLENLDLNLDT